MCCVLIGVHITRHSPSRAIRRSPLLSDIFCPSILHSQNSSANEGEMSICIAQNIPTYFRGSRSIWKAFFFYIPFVKSVGWSRSDRAKSGIGRLVEKLGRVTKRFALPQIASRPNNAQFYNRIIRRLVDFEAQNFSMIGQDGVVTIGT